MNKRTFFVFAVILSLGISAAAQSIVGVWKVTDESGAGPDAKAKPVTQPRMYFFTKKHYSIIAVTSENARPSIDMATATAEQLRDVFVDSFVANAGTYEYKAGKLSIWPMVAKSPGYMTTGMNATFVVKMAGKTMMITGETANKEPVKTPHTLTLTRVE